MRGNGLGLISSGFPCGGLEAARPRATLSPVVSESRKKSPRCFKIASVVINDTINFGGNEDFLCERGVEVIHVAHAPLIAQMHAFIRNNPALWNEDIGE